MRLPEDIIRLIADCAFDIGAFDCSPGCTKPATRMSTAFALEGLEGTARAICLVSHLFYRLCIPRFYEVVAVHDHRLLHSLAASLRAPLAFIERSRGFYCRRLDIDIWIHTYTDWSHGATTLWGLILACPRLEILNIHVVSTSERLVWDQCLCPVSLLIQIANAYGPSLRRFELRGLVNVHFSGIRYLASRCSRLEILCVPRMFAEQDDHESDVLEDDLDLTEGRILLTSETIKRATPLMSADEQQIFARTHAQALDAARNAPQGCVEFPHLHTLEVGNYIDFTQHWSFPRGLRVLHTSFLGYDESDMEIGRCRDAQTCAVRRLGAHLVAWTVALTDEFCPWAQLRDLPNLQYIGFVVDDYEETPEHYLQRGRALQEVDLVIRSVMLLAEPWAWLSFLHTLAETAELPALRTVRVVGTHLPAEWEPRFGEWKTSFARVHVRLEFAPGYLRPSPTVFHVPILSDTCVSIPEEGESADVMVALYAREHPDLVRRLRSKSRGVYPGV